MAHLRRGSPQAQLHRAGSLLNIRQWFVREATWVVVLVIVAGWWGGRYVERWREAGRPQIFYQHYFEPALMIACGRGFHTAMQQAPAVEAFLMQRADRFDCASLPPAHDFQHRPPNAIFQYAWFYLMWMVGAFWWVFGVSWSGLVPLFGALFAVVILLAYVIFRLAVPAWAALPAAAALTLSTLHLQNLPHLRDYAKAPFVLALLLILFVLVKGVSSPKRLIGLATVYGLILGIGYGFRTDLLANILPFVVAVAVFVTGWRPRDLLVKATALMAAAAVFTAVSWPVISYVRAQGGCQWHVILLGLEHNYDDNLGVTPTFYQWITRYTDEYLVASVNSFVNRTEGAPAATYCSADYDVASEKYLATIVSTFPADVVTRTYASILQVADLPFYLWSAPDPEHHYSRIGRMLSQVVGTSRLSVALMVLAIGAVSWRLGLFAVCVVVYVAGYPMLQFAQRHFFHLEFLGWWAMAFVFAGTVRAVIGMAQRGERPWSVPRAVVRRGAAFAVTAVVLLLLPVPIVRAYQERAVTALVNTLIEAPRVPVTMTPGESATSIRVDARPAPEDPTGTVYLDVRVDLAACPDGVPLSLEYDHANALEDFSIALYPQPRNVVVERFMTPVFRGFRGVSTGGAPVSCVAGIDRLATVRGVPLLPTLTLPRDWRTLPYHQSIATRTWRLGFLGQ